MILYSVIVTFTIVNVTIAASRWANTGAMKIGKSHKRFVMFQHMHHRFSAWLNEIGPSHIGLSHKVDMEAAE
jgi:hypothetical protein